MSDSAEIRTAKPVSKPLRRMLHPIRPMLLHLFERCSHVLPDRRDLFRVFEQKPIGSASQVVIDSKVANRNREKDILLTQDILLSARNRICQFENVQSHVVGA